MIREEDEHCLKRYRKQCMQDMHERLSFGPTFEEVHELETGDAFLEVIEKEHRLTLVVVHIYQHGIQGVLLLLPSLSSGTPDTAPVENSPMNSIDIP